MKRVGLTSVVNPVPSHHRTLQIRSLVVSVCGCLTVCSTSPITELTRNYEDILMLENNFLLFTVPIVSVVGLLLFYMTWKTNGKIREYLNTKGKLVMFGLTVAVVAPAAVALLLTAIAYGEKA